MNRIGVESVCSMMSHFKLPTEFCAETVKAAIYVRNRNLTALLEGMTPSERLLHRCTNSLKYSEEFRKEISKAFVCWIS